MQQYTVGVYEGPTIEGMVRLIISQRVGQDAPEGKQQFIWWFFELIASSSTLKCVVRGKIIDSGETLVREAQAGRPIRLLHLGWEVAILERKARSCRKQN